MSDRELIDDALEEFEKCADAEVNNRAAALDDIEFTFLDKQWSDADIEARRRDCRPCLTINKTRQFVKQVVNNGRRNKPAIKVHPADSFADPKTAEIINGLIRNIEYTSNADVAYDTGFEAAVAGGFGYWRVDVDYAHDDSFDRELKICRIPNQFSVYGDYESTAADSSDWNRAFITDCIAKDAFERRWKGADAVDWDSGRYSNLPNNWTRDERVVIAEYWTREEVQKKIVQLSDKRVVPADWLKQPLDGYPGATMLDLLESEGISVTGERDSRGYKVQQRIMTGAEVLETNEWRGMYIPIVPVYGEELNIEGVRHFRSLIRSGKDAQRMFNYWRSLTTELIAMSPKTPFIGKVGQFDTDQSKWQTANTQSHAYIEYDDANGVGAPTRQGFAGVPAGPLQEAMNASDDMKAIFGMYDASLGARSNETSGVAISARQQQGEMSNFHFMDNQSRAVGHTGRILLDLIQHFYTGERVIRILGLDKKPQNIKITNQQQPQQNGTEQMFNLAIGKYDLTVDSGPGFATQREDAAYQMTEFIKVFPQSAPFIGDLLAKNQDWPDADEFAARLKAMLPPQAQGQNPMLDQMKQALDQAHQQQQQMQAEIAKLNMQLQSNGQDHSIDQQKLLIDQWKLRVEAYKAETDRIAIEAPAMDPVQVQALVDKTVQQSLSARSINDSAPQPQPQAQPAMPAAQPAPAPAPEMPQSSGQMPDDSGEFHQPNPE